MDLQIGSVPAIQAQINAVQLEYADWRSLSFGANRKASKEKNEQVTQKDKLAGAKWTGAHDLRRLS